MYRSIIVDDEVKLREVLIAKVETHCPELTVVGVGSSIHEAAQLILEESPDIVFLDIEMPGGSGFDLLETLDDIDFEVIFITGYNEYAVQALRMCAIDYLLKPLKSEELKRAVEKAIESIKKDDIVEKYTVLQQNLNNVGDQSMKIGIPNNDTYEFVQVKDIIRCEGWNKYTKVHIADGRVLVSSYNIGVYKEMLQDYGFYSTHKSHYVNKQHIKSYRKEGLIIMSDSSEVPIARRRKDDFVQTVLGDHIIR